MSQARLLYEFKEFRLESGPRRLYRRGEDIHITPKDFETLLALVERHDELVAKEELLARVWPGTFVTEENLTQRISRLRKILGDSADDQRYILTVPGAGYRFAAPVRVYPEDSEAKSHVKSPAFQAGPMQPSVPSASPPEHSESFTRNRVLSAVVLVLIAIAIGGLSDRISRRTGQADQVSPRGGEPITPPVRPPTSSSAKPSPRDLEKLGTRSIEAADLYAQGCFFWNQRSRDGLFRSIASFKRAIDKDPSFALAYAGLAEVYAGDLVNLHQVEPLARKAISLNNKLAEPHVTISFIKMVSGWNWDDARRELDAAIQLNPQYPRARQYHGMYLAAQGKLEEAERELLSARKLDPDSLSIRSDLAQILFFRRKYEQAIEHAQKILQHDPEFFFAHQTLYDAYTLMGMYREAVGEYTKLSELLGLPKDELLKLEQILMINGVRSMWRAQINLQLRHFPAENKAYEIAECYSLLGSADETLEYLYMAIKKPIAYSLIYLKVNPIFDNIRRDDRFAGVLRLLHLPPASKS